MSLALFSVSGRDEYHDRGIRQFRCFGPDEAAREYLEAYVEDWRGSHFDELRLSLLVQRDGEAAEKSLRYSGIASTSQNPQGAFEITYKVRQEI